MEIPTSLPIGTTGYATRTYYDPLGYIIADDKVQIIGVDDKLGYSIRSLTTGVVIKNTGFDSVTRTFLC